MPVIDPRNRGQAMPTDWRWAYDQFRQLKTLGAIVGEPVHRWSLEFPSRSRRIFDGRWSMTYTWQGNVYSKVFLGLNGKESGQAIAKILPIYRDLVARKKASQAKPKSDPHKPNPMWDNENNRQWRNRFNQEVKKVRDTRSQQAFEEANVRLLKYMKRRAGILPMSIQEYWFSHPHSSLFPAPPPTKEEFDRRQRILESKIREREKAVKMQQEAGTYDPRYIPPL